ncbi:hypothetical protein C8C83_5612 [Flavobacterium sp. 90]|uniref:hypothetical protein n=1 Tax=unclassified Flavobacterium TaxID=196869 RepID=UPI000EAF37F1|nr:MULTISPECIES: hypothetical protein [unclassified Flavobacterium]RKR08374.1 hypothetical protein C8C82_0243 [Flavobacterium sp. 81]TCK57562.1 hypothetical protein C8C83_5612 [Flavobacterium sp. 90]
MKKYACLLLFALLLNGCDDGNLTVDSIDFDTVASTNCDTTNTLLYKLKDREALLLQLPPSSLENNPTLQDTLTYDIDNNLYRVLYRAYDGKVEVANICGLIPPKTPNVIEEWVGTKGKIQITTTQISSAPSEVDGSTRVTGYNHSIVFKNITFLKPAGPQVEQKYVFGDFKITINPTPLTFAKPEEAGECPDQNQVYNYNAAFYIMLQNFDPTLFVNEATPADKPRIRDITATQNNVIYRTLTGVALNKDYFCKGSLTPTNPAIKETWNGTNGTVEVATQVTNNIVMHTITLRNVTLVKENSSFKLGNNFVLGTVTKAKN